MRTLNQAPPSPDLANFLFGAYRRQVLALLLLRPDESFHVREISRLTGVPAGSLHRELRSLGEAGLLRREPLGNQVRYSADSGSAIFGELAAMLRKTADNLEPPPQSSARFKPVQRLGGSAAGARTLHSPRAGYAARPERTPAHLKNMLDAAREAFGMVKAVPASRFLRDRLRVLALERALQTMGEAARRVTPRLQATHPEIEWRAIIGQRNLLVNEYGLVDHGSLYRSARERMPRIIGALERLVGES